MSSPPSERAKVRRLAERARYEREDVAAVLDEALVCHVGFVHDGSPIVIPTIHARRDDTLYVHGSPASRMLRSIDGAEISVSATIVDGLVLARSHFHHSLNYRSAVVFGRARTVVDLEEKKVAFRAIVEHIMPGRWDDARRPNERETRATTIVALPLDEASVKLRTGPPEDDAADYALDVWAGVVPLRLEPGVPEPDARLHPGIELPEYLVEHLGAYRLSGERT